MTIGWPAPEIQWAILLSIATPFVLLLTRWLPFGVANRFNITAAAVLVIYALGCLQGPADAAQITAVTAGAALVVSALVIVLGFWGLLTRGYSVALLIALARLGGRARIIEIENAYSGGRGLRWLAGKRLSGLKTARVIDIVDDHVVITNGMGMMALRAYAVFRACFRLKDYG